MLDYEKPLYQKGYKLIVGCDEAGRGPLCGPVVCAACIMEENYINDEINDSKKLTDKKRRQLFDVIISHAISYAIVAISPQEIDKINIYEASRKGMQDAIDLLKVKPDYILTDAMPLLKFKDIPQEAIIKGDAKSINIAAASILAKVTRDNILLEYDKKYPQYQFAKHKGYPTKLHLELLEKYGPIKEIYRFSYKPVQKFNYEQIKLDI
ncbi:ribonuclease HII [Firmicutes bacterium CAG:449]|jgi:ribonuclease HII|nr:ribonuclease HII [Firmicutes bacterium CAG:449]